MNGPLRLAAALLFSLPLALLPSSEATAETLEFSGSASSSFGVYLFSCPFGCQFLDYENRNVLAFQLDAELGPQVATRGGVSLHNNNTPDVRRLEDAGEFSRVQPVDLRITDAWISAYGIFHDDLDLRIGAQTRRWGTGDGYSPADRLSPMDFSDPTVFDQRLAAPAVHADFYRSSLTFSATWFPFFIPSLLSGRLVNVLAGPDAADDLDFDGELPGDAPEINDVRTRIEIPRQSIRESAFAFRLDWAAPIADFALGFYTGRDNLPQLSGEVAPENFFSGNRTDLLVNLRYPWLHMVAFETRAPIGNAWTGWIDAVVVFPSRTELFITRDRMLDLERLNVIDEAPDDDIRAVTQSGTPYPNLVLGADTTVGDRFYLNFQYFFGFLLERDFEDLNHYGLVTLRTPAFEGPLEFEFTGGAEASQRFDAFGFTTRAHVLYRFADRLELRASGLLQAGQEDTTLGRFSALSEARITATAHF